MLDKDLSRYSAIDVYTLEELKRRYASSTPRERIQLFADLYDAGMMPPYELALLAVTDESCDVRAWMARHARYLDYRESPDDCDDKDVLADADRDLTQKLRDDEDEFVRACLFENVALFADRSDEEWLKLFRNASHMERLALVRNPRSHNVQRFLETIVDPENDDVELALSEREQLVNALLISRQALAQSHLKGQVVMPDLLDARVFSRLWRLINKWPAESRIKRNIYLYIGTTIKTKAGIYRQCKQPTFRADILRNVDPEDTDTLELGMKDSDERCRYLAYAKIKNLSLGRFELILDTDDMHALLGLAENEFLSIDQLEEVKDRLFALGAHEQARWATETIERIKKKQAPHNPEDLFVRTDEEPRFLPEKINMIGNLLLTLQREVDYIEDILEGNDKLKP